MSDEDRARRTGPRELAVHVTPRYRVARALTRLVVGLLFDLRCDGLERWPSGPFLLVSNHHSGWDPMLIIAATPLRPRITWFGPKEADFSRGFKNRVMGYVGGMIPYNPEKTTLVSAVRAVRRVFEAAGVLAIFAEGHVGFRETEVQEFEEGAVAFATASTVPVVPCAIVGSSEMWFRSRVRIRFGEPISSEGFRGAAGRAELERQVRDGIQALLPEREPRLPRRRLLAGLGEIFDGAADRERHARDRHARDRALANRPG